MVLELLKHCWLCLLNLVQVPSLSTPSDRHFQVPGGGPAFSVERACAVVNCLGQHPPWGSNPRPRASKARALPTELEGRTETLQNLNTLTNIVMKYVLLEFKKVVRAVPGIEPGTSPTLRENHTTRPNSLLRMSTVGFQQQFQFASTLVLV